MWSLRARLTLLASLGVLIVLAGGSAALFAIQQRQLLENVDRSLTERADAIEGLLGPDELPGVFTADDEDRAVQIVDAEGVVVVSSANISGEPAVAPVPGAAADTIRTIDPFPVGEDPFRVLSRSVGGELTLHVAENTDDVSDTSESLLVSLALAVPAVTLVFAWLSWLLVGRTLGPVDRMRAQVDAIADTHVRHQIDQPERADEIGKLAHTMNQMLHRLHDAGAKQRRFVADAAHELRTPLTRIRATVEVDLAQPDTADHARSAEEVRQEAVGLQSLLDDLLVLASADDGAAPHTSRPFDLDEIVRDEARWLRKQREELSVDASAVRPVEILGDEDQVRRVVRNLLSNAERHAERRVVLSAIEVGDFAEFTVDDDGAGIAPDDRGLVFGRFTRLDEARTRDGGGAGLGLAIVRDLAERHGGSVDVEDAPLGGARFVVRLPRRRS